MASTGGSPSNISPQCLCLLSMANRLRGLSEKSELMAARRWRKLSEYVSFSRSTSGASQQLGSRSGLATTLIS